MLPSPKKRLAIVCSALLVTLTVLYLGRSPILTGAANAWAVNDPVTQADAIVVLGGRIDVRPFAAARLYHQGIVPRILYMDAQPSPTTEVGLTLRDTELTQYVLLSNNVPESAMEVIGNHVLNTFEEARAARAWAQENQAKRIIVATDLFHSRRVHWVFSKVFDGTPAQVAILASDPRAYHATNWWQNEQGIVDFQNEIIKMAYYWLKY